MGVASRTGVDIDVDQAWPVGRMPYGQSGLLDGLTVGGLPWLFPVVDMAAGL